eukprot:227020_1
MNMKNINKMNIIWLVIQIIHFFFRECLKHIESFKDYITFDNFDIALNELVTTNNNNIALRALDEIAKYSMDMSRLQKISNIGIAKKLLQILDSDKIMLHPKSIKLLLRIRQNINMAATKMRSHYFDKNAIEILINIIDTTQDVSLIIDTLRTLGTLIAKLKEIILQNNILDCLLTVCSSQIICHISIVERVCELISRLCFDSCGMKIIYITKILQIFSILCQIKMKSKLTSDVKLIEIYLVKIYNYLNNINDNMKLFDGDIVIDSYSFVQNNQKQYLKLLVCGFIRRDINKYIIPNDIALNCAIFMDYCSFPVQQLMELEQYSFLTKLVSKAIDSVPNKRQLRIIKLIRSLISSKHPEQPIQSVLDIGIVPKLLPFLRCDKHIDVKLQSETVWLFLNICSGTEEQVQYIIDIGAVPLLINLCNSKSYEVKESAIWAVGNIAGDNANSRNVVLRHDVLSSLLPLCNTNIETEQQRNILRHVAWTVSNCCRGKPNPNWEYIELLLKGLSILIRSDDNEILDDSSWAMSYLMDVEEWNSTEMQMIDIIINNGSLHRLIQLLDHELPKIIHAALRTIGNIVTGSDDQTQQVINFGVLKKLHHLMTYDTPEIKREACWTISNITAGSSQHVQHVIDANLIPPLIYIFNTEKFEVSKEALWAIRNATGCATNVQIEWIVNQGVIKPLCRFFNPNIRKSNKCLLVAFKTIENILNHDDTTNNIYAQCVKQANGVDYLQQILKHEATPDEIYDKALYMIENYFDA